MKKAEIKELLSNELLVITRRSNKGIDLPYLDLCYTIVNYLNDLLCEHGIRYFNQVLKDLEPKLALKLYHKSYYCAGLKPEDEQRFMKCYDNLRNYILR